MINVYWRIRETHSHFYMIEFWSDAGNKALLKVNYLSERSLMNAAAPYFGTKITMIEQKSGT